MRTTTKNHINHSSADLQLLDSAKNPHDTYNNDFRMATWNAKTLNETRKLVNEYLTEDKANVNILGVGEVTEIIYIRSVQDILFF